MPTFTTPRRTCIGHTAGSFNPLSEALSTADLCEVVAGAANPRPFGEQRAAHRQAR